MYIHVKIFEVFNTLLNISDFYNGIHTQTSANDNERATMGKRQIQITLSKPILQISLAKICMINYINI